MAKEILTYPIVDFDQIIEREGTDAEKYDARQAVFGTTDVLPMWIADQDLPTPAFILDALKQRLEHPILGYTHMSDTLYQSVIDWHAQQDYCVQKSDIVWTHNVANGFHLAVQALTQAGDAILVQPPVYPPFLKAPELNDRRCVEAPLSLVNGRYEIDFLAFEQTLIQHQVKLFLFCNPQNPSGRVWLKDELIQLGELCLKHQVVVISDEIHSDLVYDGHQHIPMASLSHAFAQNTLTLSSPGKTFNLGGLEIGYALIANPALKQAYQAHCHSLKINDINLFAATALKTAYSDLGRNHQRQLLTYLQSNLDEAETFFKTYMPKIKMMRPEASYLIWLDFSDLFTDQSQLKTWLITQAKLGLGDGQNFGNSGTGYMRMNIALPKSRLKIALNQLQQTYIKVNKGN